MFDSLVITRKERPAQRRWFTLPLAATLHLAAGGAYLAAGLYAPQEILPPLPKNLFELPSVSVVLVNRRELEAKPVRNQAPKRSATPLVPVHDNLPTEILPPPPKEEAIPLLLPENAVVEPTDGDTDLGTGLTGPLPLFKVHDMSTPPRLLDMVKPEYPPALRAMGLTGKVVFEVEVDEMGTVTGVKVVQSTNPLFTESAERAVRQWRYSRPLAPGGGQCRVSLFVTLRFTTG